MLMRTGMRWAILTKLPVALSGVITENSEPVAGEICSTCPRIFAWFRASTVK
jgi:hypothetical protein